MTDSPPLTPGQAAYHAHARAFLHPDQLQDHLLTEAWEALSPDDQQRWEAAGQAALGHLQCRPLLEGPGARAPAREVRAHLARAEQAWAPFVTGPDGQLDRDKVFAELADYSVLLDNTTQVYLHVTNRAASNPFIQADVIKALADGVTSDVASDEVADALVKLARSLDEKDHAGVLELIDRAATEYGVQDLPQRLERQNAAAGQDRQTCASGNLQPGDWVRVTGPCKTIRGTALVPIEEEVGLIVDTYAEAEGADFLVCVRGLADLYECRAPQLTRITRAEALA